MGGTRERRGGAAAACTKTFVVVIMNNIKEHFVVVDLPSKTAVRPLLGLIR